MNTIEQINTIAKPISNKVHIIDKFNGKATLINHSREIIQVLSQAIGTRTIDNYDNLQSARNFIYEYFHRCGTTPEEQVYDYEGKEVANIIAEIKGTKYPDEVLIIAAHYDTIQETTGADDNASGIAGLLEIHRLMKKHKPKRTVRFAAFTLEEPPIFGTENMGSMVYASKCAKRGDNIKLMISMDMLAYGGTFVRQQYPLTSMVGKYPEKGNYLVAAGLPSYSKHIYLLKKYYNRHAKVPIYEVIAPASLKGINNSDHSSFHKNGFPSLMITDTAFYRNPNYHSENDTIETLNFRFLANNIVNLFKMTKDLSNSKQLSNIENFVPEKK